MHNQNPAIEPLRARASSSVKSREGKKLAVLLGGYGESLIAFRGALIEELRERGLDVLVIVPDLSPEGRKWLQERGVAYLDVPLARTGTNPVSDVRYFAWLVDRLRREAPDLVIAYTIKPVVYGVLAAYVARVPGRYALITGLGYAFIGKGAKRALLGAVARGLYALALRRASAVFFQNPDDRELFQRSGLVPRSMATFIVNGSGIDTSRFVPTPLPTEPVVFLLIARLLGDKGVREYARAVRLLRQRHTKFVARLVGWIDTNPDAIAQSELDEWIADGTLEFLGKLSDVRPAIAASSVYVLPSYREGTPRTVLEAMAMGRPVITTDAPGCRETVTDGHNGFLVPVRSAEKLAEAMEKFLVQPELVHDMGRRSRELAESKYDVHKVNADMLHAMGVV